MFTGLCLINLMHIAILVLQIKIAYKVRCINKQIIKSKLKGRLIFPIKPMLNVWLSFL